MTRWNSTFRLAAAASLGLMLLGPDGYSLYAQEQTAAADSTAQATQSREPLSEDELEILVARVALYPDDLIAVISAASLYPLQIVEAARFLDDYEEDNSLQPKDTWDGSIISLLNYPEIVKMMSDDLDWTQALGDAIAYQQKDVLIAIQQLREEAVAKGIIKSDDKVEVTEEGDNVVIKSADPEVVYVPQYEPEMLYVPGYDPVPVAYYPDPYPLYYYPTAPFFTAAVTGAVWASVVDWDDWDVWGGHWDGGDIDIDCDNCFNNRDFDGKINFNDVDWKNVDRSKINIDKNQFANVDRTKIKNNLERNTDNSLRNRATSIKRQNTGAVAGRATKARDVRRSTLEGLQGRPGDIAAARPNVSRPSARPDIPRPSARPDISRPSARPNVSRPSARPNVSRPAASRPSANRPASVHRPASRPKPAAKIDHRPIRPSGLGNVSRGKPQKVASHRGARSMGGGRHGGGGRSMHRGGGRRR